MTAHQSRDTGRVSYDREHDLLTFRIGELPYKKSIESENLVLGLDAAGRVIGLRIFDASKVFGIDKRTLKIPHH